MTEIIASIRDFIQTWATNEFDYSPQIAVKSWGFSELVRRDATGKGKTTTQPIPMTINGTSDRKQISLDDKFDLISWIRWNRELSRRISEEDSWGLKQGKRKTLPLRIVVAHKVELGEDLIDDLASAFPDNLYINGFDFVFLNEYTIDPEHESNYLTELGETAYEKHRFKWNLYVINLNVEYLIGKTCIPVPVPVPGSGFDNYVFDSVVFDS